MDGRMVGGMDGWGMDSRNDRGKDGGRYRARDIERDSPALSGNPVLILLVRCSGSPILVSMSWISYPSCLTYSRCSILTACLGNPFCPV
jgi:hypothetical protein